MDHDLYLFLSSIEEKLDIIAEALLEGEEDSEEDKEEEEYGESKEKPEYEQ